MHVNNSKKQSNQLTSSIYPKNTSCISTWFFILDEQQDKLCSAGHKQQLKKTPQHAGQPKKKEIPTSVKIQKSSNFGGQRNSTRNMINIMSFCISKIMPRMTHKIDLLLIHTFFSSHKSKNEASFSQTCSPCKRNLLHHVHSETENIIFSLWPMNTDQRNLKQSCWTFYHAHESLERYLILNCRYLLL